MSRRPLTETSHAYQRATTMLKQPAGAWIDKQREDGTSWRHLANELYLVTKGQMHVNESTLKAWWEAWKNEADPEADPVAVSDA